MEENGKKSTKNLLWRNRPLTEEKVHNKRLIIPKEDRGLPFITFSFKYFAQQEFFGIGEQDAAWFANLLDRIKDLSGKTRLMLEDYKEREAYRLHPIDWNAKNCPITIKDLTSVPDNIKENAEADFFGNSNYPKELEES